MQKEIDWLHFNVKDKEWSGILLYEHIEGDLDDPESIVIKAHKLVLMDIGNATYTAATLDSDDIMKVYDSMPEGVNYKMGLIHTHHNMSTFFSGTDKEELQDTAPLHNYYVSLIVNYAGTYSCRIAFKADMKYLYEFKSVDDTTVLRQESAVEPVLMQMDLDIKSENGELEVSPFVARFLEVKKKKEQEEASKRTVGTSTYYGGAGYYTGGTGHTPSTQVQETNTATVQGYAQGNSKWAGEKGVQNVGELGIDLDSSHKLYSIAERDVFTLVGTWLATGLEFDEDMKPAKFTSSMNALQYFDNYFSKEINKSKLQKFLDHMTITFFNTTLKYNPKMIGDRIKHYFAGGWTRDIKIMPKLITIVENHHNFVNELSTKSLETEQSLRHKELEDWHEELTKSLRISEEERSDYNQFAL